MRPFCLGCVALVLLAAAPAQSAVRFDNAATTVGSGGKGMLALSVGTGANRFVLVAVAMPAGVSVLDRSFGGRPLAPFGSAVTGSCHIDVYGGVAPASGTGTATVSLSSGTAPFVLAAAAYDGVDQALPTDDSSAQNTGSGGAPFGNVLKGPGVQALAFAALCASGAITATAPRTGSTVRWARASGSLLGAGADSPGLQAGWQLTASGSITWAVASFPLRAAPGGAPVPVDAAAPVDGAPPPGLDAATPDASRPDAATTALDAAVPAPDAAAPSDARPLPPDGNVIALPREPPAPDAAAFRVIDLRVGTGCALPGSAPRSPSAVTVVLWLLVVVARRRRR